MKNRRQRLEEHPQQDITRVERVLVDGPERFAMVREELVLPLRGDLPFRKVMDQAFDVENVIALELTVAGEVLPDIRKLDKKLDQKIQRLVSKAGGGRLTTNGWLVHMRLCAIIG